MMNASRVLAIVLISTQLFLSPTGINNQVNAQGIDYPQRILNAGNKAISFVENGEYMKAIPYWRELLEWQRKNLGEKDSKTLLTLKNINAVLIASGQTKAAVQGYRELHEILTEIHGETSKEVIRAEIELTKSLRSAREFKQANRLALYSLKKTTNLESLSIEDEHADLLEVLGTIAHEEGYYKKAYDYHKKTFVSRHKINPVNHIKIATSLGNQAQALLRLGHYAESERLQMRALDIYQEHAPNTTKEQQSTILTNLALTQKYLGQDQKSKQTMVEALKIKTDHVGRNHPETARLLINLGIYKEEAEELKQAMSLYKEAFEILTSQTNDASLSAAFALQRMAELARSVNRPEKTKEWATAVLNIRQQELDPLHPDIATTMLTLGMADLQLGDTKSGQSWISEAINIRRERLGRYHPYTAAAELIFGLSQAESGQLKTSQHSLNQSIQHYSIFFENQVSLLPESQRIPLLNSLKSAQNLVYSLAHNGKEGAEIAMNMRLNLHGRIEEIERRSNQHKATMNTIENRGGHHESNRDNIKELTKLLNEDEVLVEYVQYKPTRFQKGVFQVNANDRYLVLTLSGDGNVKAYDLGPAEEINTLIWTALYKTQRADFDAKKSWENVAEKIISPLKDELNNAKVWYFSPDGELHRIPFSAVKTNHVTGSTQSLEPKSIRLLTTGRDLLTKNKRNRHKQRTSIVLANPDFSAIPNYQGQKIQSKLPTKLPSYWQKVRWQRLPGTQQEGESINKLIKGELFTDNVADSSRLKWDNPPSLIHIATHGAFLATKKQPGSAKDTHLNLMGKNKSWDDPMQKSVFVLSGANSNNSDIQSDAYITAKDVSLLNMKGTELVVISACDSGKGQIQLGDGIYGMRRGIAIAGAQSSLLSLWKIGDKSTATFMEKFYSQLSKGESPEDALKTTQLFLQNHKDKHLRHPFVWAAFQLYGISWK